MESLFPDDKDGERIPNDDKYCFQYVDNDECNGRC